MIEEELESAQARGWSIAAGDPRPAYLPHRKPWRAERGGRHLYDDELGRLLEGLTHLKPEPPKRAHYGTDNNDPEKERGETWQP